MLSWKLKPLRKANHLSQLELGNALSVSQQTIASWENNRSEPDMNTIVQIADYFNISTDYLLNRTEEKDAAPGIRVDTYRMTDEDINEVLNFIAFLRFKRDQKEELVE